MPKFVLPGKPKGRVVLGDRYVFVNGEMPASKADAPLLENILCRFHGCDLVYEDVVKEVAVKNDEESPLKVESTRNRTRKFRVDQETPESGDE